MQTLWLCLLSVSLPLLFWFGHVIRRDGPPPAVQSNGLRGYTRIPPNRMVQVRGRERVYTRYSCHKFGSELYFITDPENRFWIVPIFHIVLF